PATPAEKQQLERLHRAGHRLRGFCRTNLFKRLESSGEAFLRSIERHALRNLVVAHAIEHGLAIPIGSQDSGMLDPDLEDEDLEFDADLFDDADSDAETAESTADTPPGGVAVEASLRDEASRVYSLYETRYLGRFGWLRSNLFRRDL